MPALERAPSRRTPARTLFSLSTSSLVVKASKVPPDENMWKWRLSRVEPWSYPGNADAPSASLQGRSGQGRSREPSRKEACRELYVFPFHGRNVTPRRAAMEGQMLFDPSASLGHAVQDSVYLGYDVGRELHPSTVQVPILHQHTEDVASFRRRRKYFRTTIDPGSIAGAYTDYRVYRSDQIAARNPVHKRGHRGREEPVVQPATEDRLYRRSGIAGFVLRPAGRKGVLGADQAEDSEG